MSARAAQSPAIIFDFGGVLMDWNVRYLFDQLLPDRAETERVLAEIGFNEWNLEMDRGRSFAESVRELSGKFPQYAHLIRAFDERWEETQRGPLHATVEILQALAGRGYALYGLTNWSAEKYALTSRKYPLFELFDAVVVSGEVKLIKPDPRIYALLLEKIGRPAVECLFIDDSAVNVEAARQLGFQTIHFKSARQLSQELSRRNLLEELPPPAHDLKRQNPPSLPQTNR